MCNLTKLVVSYGYLALSVNLCKINKRKNLLTKGEKLCIIVKQSEKALSLGKGMVNG